MQNKTSLIIFIVIFVIIGAVFLIPTNVKNMERKVAPTTKTTEAPTVGKYLPYSPEASTATKDTRRVLFFYANWCPTCIPADASFMKEQDKIPDDVTVLRVNYNDTETDQAEKDLAAQYQITYQHTFVQIDSLGNAVTKWNGGKLEELLANIK